MTKVAEFAQIFSQDEDVLNELSLISSVAPDKRPSVLFRLCRGVAKKHNIGFRLSRPKDESKEPRVVVYQVWLHKKWPEIFQEIMKARGKSAPKKAPSSPSMPSDYPGGKDEWHKLTDDQKDELSPNPAMIGPRKEAYAQYKDSLEYAKDIIEAEATNVKNGHPASTSEELIKAKLKIEIDALTKSSKKKSPKKDLPPLRRVPASPPIIEVESPFNDDSEDDENEQMDNSDGEFDEMDIDGDGVVSREEHSKYKKQQLKKHIAWVCAQFPKKRDSKNNCAKAEWMIRHPDKYNESAETSVSNKDWKIAQEKLGVKDIDWKNATTESCMWFNRIQRED